MPFISASAITPYNSIRGGAAGEALDPILAYSPFNVWDSEHETRVGTTTTFLDYNNVGTAYDLANPAASNQPTYNASSFDFNSLPSFTFDGSSDYVINNVSNYRNSDNSGMFISVYKKLSGNLMMTLTVGAETTNRYFGYNSINSNSFRTSAAMDAGTFSFRGTENVDNTNPQLVTYAGTGSEYKMWIGDSEQSIVIIQGNNDGAKWLDSTNDYGNLAIGARVSPTISYSNIEWCFSGYFPYVDDATTLEIIAILKTKYAI